MNWRQEAIKVAMTFAIFVGGSFALTENNPVNDWRSWALNILISGSRVAVSQFVASLATWQAARKG